MISLSRLRRLFRCCGTGPPSDLDVKLASEPKSDAGSPAGNDAGSPAGRDAGSPASDTSKTFKVSNVEDSRRLYREQKNYVEELRDKFRDRLEACSVHRVIEYSAINGLFDVIHLCFSRHNCLVLTPEAIWLAITQGFGIHILGNDKYRHHVAPRPDDLDPGRIQFQHDSLISGADKNDWNSALPMLSDQVRRTMRPDLHEILTADFTGTTMEGRLCSQIVLRDVVPQSYGYGVATNCGIPSVTLEGPQDDWARLLDKTKRLQNWATVHKLDLEWWFRHLVPVVTSVAKARRGSPDPKFWCSLYKRDEKSGSPFITGWINVLYPYLDVGSRTYRRNPLVNWRRGGHGNPPNVYPKGLSVMSYDWNSRGDKCEMNLLAGFVGVSQNPRTKALKPEIGWYLLRS